LNRIDSEIVITIKDSGIGVQPCAMTTIFDRYAQEAVRPNGGLGIGLTVVKRVVESHNGRIVVTSAGEVCGSEFAIHLPLQ
jgi:signal transduction histidine kinase